MSMRVYICEAFISYFLLLPNDTLFTIRCIFVPRMLKLSQFYSAHISRRNGPRTHSYIFVVYIFILSTCMVMQLGVHTASSIVVCLRDVKSSRPVRP